MKDRIKKLRKSLELTQQAFADKLGIRQNTIAKYETGRGIPTTAVIALIVREFHVNEEWLRTGEGEMFSPQKVDALEELVKQRNLTDTDRLLIEKFLKLRADERQVVIKYALSVAADYVQPPAQTREEIEREAEEYALQIKEQYILEKKREQQASSVNGQDMV